MYISIDTRKYLLPLSLSFLKTDPILVAATEGEAQEAGEERRCRGEGERQTEEALMHNSVMEPRDRSDFEILRHNSVDKYFIF